MQPGKVLVAYLHTGWSVEHSWHASMVSLLNYDAAHNQRLFGSANGPLTARCGSSGLVDGRNQVMKQFLDEFEEEWLWFVDTDMGYPANVVDLLVDAADPQTRPVVGALCFGLKMNDPDGYGGYTVEPFPTIYGWVKGSAGFHGFSHATSYPPDTLLRVAGTGTACLLIHRSVGERVRERFGDDWFVPVRYPDRRMVSEDLSFCYRLGQLEIPVYVHTGIRTTHAKQIWVGEREFLAHKALRELENAAGAELVAGDTLELPAGDPAPAGAPVSEAVAGG